MSSSASLILLSDLFFLSGFIMGMMLKSNLGKMMILDVMYLQGYFQKLLMMN